MGDKQNSGLNLRKDLTSMARHELLLFLAGSTW